MTGSIRVNEWVDKTSKNLLPKLEGYRQCRIRQRRCDDYHTQAAVAAQAESPRRIQAAGAGRATLTSRLCCQSGGDSTTVTLAAATDLDPQCGAYYL